MVWLVLAAEQLDELVLAVEQTIKSGVSDEMPVVCIPFNLVKALELDCVTA